MNINSKKLLFGKLYSEVIYHRVFHLFTNDSEAYLAASFSLLQFLSFIGTGILYTQSSLTSNDAGTEILRKFFYLLSMMDPIQPTDNEVFLSKFFGVIFCLIFLLFHFLILGYWIFGNKKLSTPKILRSFFSFYSFYYPNFIHFILQNIGLFIIKKYDIEQGLQVFILVLLAVGNIEAFLMLVFTNDTIYVRNLLARKKLAVNYVEYILKAFLSYFVIFQAENMDPMTFRIILNVTIFIMICVCLSQPTFYYPKMFTLSLTLRTMTQVIAFFPLIYSNFMKTSMELLTWPYISIALLIVLKFAINARKGVFYPLIEHIWNPTSVNDSLNCYFLAYEIFSKIQFTTHTNRNLTKDELYARGLLRNIGESLLKDENIQINNRNILRRSLEKEQLIELKDLVLENLMRRYYIKFNSQVLGFNLLTKMILNETKINYSQIVTILHTLRKYKWSLYQQSLIDMLVRMLKEDKTNSKELDVDCIIKFEQKYFKLLKMIEQESDLHLNFWELCQNSVISAEKIFDLSQKIDSSYKRISGFWSRILRKNIYKGPHFYFLYGYYEIIIRNNQIKSQELSNTIRQIIQPAKNNSNLITSQVLSSSNAVITISGDQKNIGQIVFCSEGIRKLLGYEIDNVISKNINIIVPELFQRRHHHYIQHFIDTNQPKIIDKQICLFAVDKEGFFVPMNAIIKFFPFSHLGLTFTGVFKKFDRFGECFIFSKDGTFLGSTRTISKKLCFQPRELYNLKIGDIFEGIEQTIEDQLKNFFPYDYPRQKIIPNIQTLEILENLMEDFPDEMNRVFKDNFLPLRFRYLSHKSRQQKITNQQQFEFNLTFQKFTEFNIYVLKIKTHQVNNTISAISLKKMENNIPTILFADKIEDSNLFGDIPSEISMRSSQKIPSHRDFERKVSNDLLYVLPNHETFDENYSDKNEIEKTTHEKSDRIGKSNGHLLQVNASKYNESIMVRDLQKDLNGKNTENTNTGLQYENTFKNSDMNLGGDSYLDEVNSVYYDLSDIDKNDESFHFNKVLADQNSVTSSKYSNENKTHQNFKHAIYESYHPLSITFLQISLALFAIISIIFFGCIGLIGNHSISIVKSTIDLIFLAEMRQDALIEYNRRARLIEIVEENLIPLSRHASIGVPNYVTYLIERLSIQSDLVIDYNHQFLGNMTHLSSNIKEILFQKNVNLDYSSKVELGSGLNLIEKRNLFDANDEIAWAGFPISKKATTLRRNDPNLQFILKNSLNDLLKESENTLKFLKESVEENLNNTLLIIEIFFGMLIVLGIFVLGGTIFYNAIVYRKIVQSFMEAFIKLDLEEASFIYDKISSVVHHLMRSPKYEIGKWNKTKITENKKKKSDGSNSRKDKKRKFSIGLMLRKPFKDALLLFSIVITSLIMIVFIYQKFDDFLINTFAMENRIIYSISDLTSVGVAMTAAYEFVSEDTETKIKNEPISNVIDSLISNIGNIQESFQAYSNDGIDIESRYSKYITGNLCTSATTSAAICLLDEKVNKHGILASKTFFSSTFKTLIENYMKSNKTESSKKQLFSDKDLVSVERMITVTLRPAFLNLQKLLINDLEICLSDYLYQNNIIIIISIILMIFLPSVVMKFVMKKLLGQYDRIKIILKPMPVQMLMENKMMMSVIKKLSPKTRSFEPGR